MRDVRDDEGRSGEGRGGWERSHLQLEEQVEKVMEGAWKGEEVGEIARDRTCSPQP